MLRLIFLTTLLSAASIFVVSSPEADSWEDPLHSFFNWGSSGNEKNTPGNGKNTPAADSCGDFKQERVCDTYLSRFLNIFLQNTGLKDFYMRNDDDLKTVTIDITVSKKTLNTLQRFSAGEKVPYGDLDESFAQFFQTGRKESHSETSFDYAGFGFSFPLLSINSIIVISCVILVLYIRYFINGMRLSAFFTLIFLAYYSVKVCQSLWSQYEDITAGKIIAMESSLDGRGHVRIPDACFPDRQTLMDKFHSLLFGDSCKQYLESKKSTFSSIDFTQALIAPLLACWTTVIPEFGDKAGKGVSAFTGHFSSATSFIIVPMIIYCFFSNLPSLCLSIFSTMSPFKSSRFNCSNTSPGTGTSLPLPPQNVAPAISPVTVIFNQAGPSGSNCTVGPGPSNMASFDQPGNVFSSSLLSPEKPSFDLCLPKQRKKSKLERDIALLREKRKRHRLSLSLMHL